MRTIDNDIYDLLGGDWWAEDSFMAVLQHAINPPRFDYFREVLLHRLGRKAEGLSVLDVGCGGGLLSERFADLGCKVTGVDRSVSTLAAARTHAGAGGLDINYLQGDAGTLPVDSGSFDVVLCCDVLEHVDHVGAVIGEIDRVMAPGGVFFFDTINRTRRSWLVTIKMAQDWSLTRLLPRDVHVWEKYIRPQELASNLERAGLQVCELMGLRPRIGPAAALAVLGLKLGLASHGAVGRSLVLQRSSDLSISYMGYATRPMPSSKECS
jgi:2-polyprenyl-6-hydroxyphenyl methylase / 3-demethylubiquinone-9 3-methyltransferase